MNLITPIRRLILLRKSFILMALGAIIGLFSASATADITNVPNAAQMLENIATSVGSLMQLTTAIAYVLGMFLVIKGVFGLKEYGESRTHHQQGGLKGPLLMLTSGTFLLYLPSAVQTGISTFWNSTSPLAYVAQSDDEWAQLMSSLFMVVQLIGTIAFIRGLVILSHLGDGGHHQGGGLGKAMAHIVGGIFCINMYQFIQTVTNTLFYGQ